MMTIDEISRNLLDCSYGDIFEYGGIDFVCATRVDKEQVWQEADFFFKVGRVEFRKFSGNESLTCTSWTRNPDAAIDIILAMLKVNSVILDSGFGDIDVEALARRLTGK